MLRKLVLLLVVLGLVALQVGSAAAAPPPGRGNPRTIILSAFGFKDASGNYGGETGPFLSRLENAEDVSAEVPFCQFAWQGTLYKQPVVVVAMGVGKVNAAACMMDLLGQYRGRIKEVIWSGIAGITPMVGGMVAADGSLRHDVPTVIGDVCAGYVLKDWDLQYSSIYEGVWWESGTNPSKTAVGSAQLAADLYAAGQTVDWPPLPAGPTANVTKYHGASAVRPATIFPPTTCIEVTGDNFWHGVKEDARARELAAQTLTVNGVPASADNLIIQTAMEGTGWANVLEMWAKATGETIPWAYTRSASNFDHPWFLPGTTTPAVTAQESITAGMAGGGMSYSSITAALPVLKLLETRNTQ